METTTSDPRSQRSDRSVVTVPNVLSIARLVVVPVFVWLFVTGREDAAVLLYAVAAWTDFFDGYIARRLGQVTELGKLLDPLADRVFIVALAVALIAREQILPLWLGIVIVGRDVLVVAAFPLLDRSGMTRIPVTFVGKTATASLLMGLTLLAVSVTSLELRYVESLGLGFTVFGAIAYWAAAGMYAREAKIRLKALREGDR